MIQLKEKGTKAQLHVRMTMKAKKELVTAAKRRGMSISLYVNWLLAEGLDQAYDAGWCDAMEAYATWLNGEQLVGAGRNLKQELKRRKETYNYGQRKSTYS